MLNTLSPLRGTAVSICQHVLKRNPAMRPFSAVGHLATLQELDQERSRDVENPGGLLCRQLSVARNKGNGVPVRHMMNDLMEQFIDRGGNWHL